MIRRKITALLATLGIVGPSAAWPAVGSFLVTNNDVPIPHPAQSYRGSSTTFYTLGADGTVSDKAVVLSKGDGIGGGSFSLSRLALVPQAGDVCVFASNAKTEDISALSAATRTLKGVFSASLADTGSMNGVGLVANASYLYASFSYSSTIATFEIETGCGLKFVSSTFSAGLNGGAVGGTALHGSTLVVTYGDGSIASFNIAGGTPVPDNDAQNSRGSASDHLPNGVVISSDGHFAIFGDASTIATIEVSDLSSGMLKPTVAYNVGTGWNSGNVQLSGDDSVIFVTDNSGGEITAAFFDKRTGEVAPGCSSGPLNGFYSSWLYAGGASVQVPTGQGGFIYVPEFGASGYSSIGVVQFSSEGRRCTLTELASSPLVDSTDASALLSIATYPGS